MSWRVLQEALGGQAASTPLGLKKCCIGAGEHQAIAALMIAHALSRDTPHHALHADGTVLSSGQGVCLLHQPEVEHPLKQPRIKMRDILESCVARCHLSSVGLGFGCALLTASGS